MMILVPILGNGHHGKECYGSLDGLHTGML